MKLGAEAATLIVNADATITTAEGSATYTINGVDFTAVESGLSIVANGEGVQLEGGTVSTLGTLQVSNETTDVVVENDSDGVVVTAESGTVISITGLSSESDEETGDVVNGKVTFNGKTYEMIGDVLKVTESDDDGNEFETLYSGSGEETDLLALNNPNMAYFQIVNGAINLAAGIEAMATTDTEVTVSYGTDDSYLSSDSSLINFTGAENAYVLAKANDEVDLGEGLTIDAAAAGSDVTITTDFEVSVTTSAENAVTVNGDKYVAADDVTINVINSDSDSGIYDSALFSGTVVLNGADSDTAAVKTTTDEFFRVSSETAINVTAGEGIVTEISAIDENDTFTFTDSDGSITYTRKSYGLILEASVEVVDSDTGETSTVEVARVLDEDPEEVGTLTSDEVSNGNWLDLYATDSEGTLSLTDVESGGYVVSADLNSKYGELTFEDGFTLNGTDDAADGIKKVVLGTEITAIRVDFATQVETTDDADSDAYITYNQRHNRS